MVPPGLTAILLRGIASYIAIRNTIRNSYSSTKFELQLGGTVEIRTTIQAIISNYNCSNCNSVLEKLQ